jgi:hypothetical protein
VYTSFEPPRFYQNDLAMENTVDVSGKPSDLRGVSVTNNKFLVMIV